MLSIRPDLVRRQLAPELPLGPRGLYAYEPAPGLNLQRHGEWGRSGGTTDPASLADVDAGARIRREHTAGLVAVLRRFHELTEDEERDERG
jgi:creatinine amidohydrolase